MKKNIRIIVADDNSLVREMLVDGIADQKDFEILATASNGRETIELIKEHEPVSYTHLDVYKRQVN